MTTHTPIDATRCIDIKFLKSLGSLDRRSSGTLNWNRGGEPCGFINYRHSNDVLQLNYRFRENGSDWQPVKQTINILKTPCNYGGHRKWLECPNCKRRVGILAGADVYFACRHCYKLAYGSQNETKADRLIRAKEKIGKQIFEDYSHGEGYFKKKGMHQKTFDRLYLKYQWLDSLWSETFVRYCLDRGYVNRSS